MKNKTGLNYIRNLYDITLDELGKEILKVGKATISKYESGKIPISEDKLKLLSEYFNGIPKEYFQKELSDKEKIKIQGEKLAKEIDKIEFTESLITEELKKALQSMEGRETLIEIVGLINCNITIKKLTWFSNLDKNEEILKLWDTENKDLDFYIILYPSLRIEIYPADDGCAIVFYGQEVRISLFTDF